MAEIRKRIVFHGRVQGVGFVEHFTEIFSYASHQEGNNNS